MAEAEKDTLAKGVRRRLREQRGESIAEVLLAVLISALALVLLAGMISASADMIEHSRNTMDDYIAAENALAEKSASDAERVMIETKTKTESVAFRLTDGGNGDVYCYINDALSGNVIAYKDAAR